MPLPYPSKSPLFAGLTRIPTILCLLSEPTDELLTELYSLTNRIEVFADGVYLELSLTDAELVRSNYPASAAVAQSKQEAHLLALSGGASTETISLDVLLQLGVKPTTVERLTWLGVTTLGELTTWSTSQVQAYLGDEAGQVLYFLKKRDTNVALYTPPHFLSEHYSFAEPATEPYQIMSVLEHLCTCLAEKLGDKAAGVLELRAEVKGLRFNARRVAKLPLKGESIYLSAQEALKQSGVLGFEVDGLKLFLRNIERPSEQLALWRQKRFNEAVAKVEKRFPGAMLSIQERDPYSLLSEYRFAFVPVKGVKREDSQDNFAKRPTEERRRLAGLVGA